ncbi:MAG: phospholipase C [Acidimicrobiales bacterium]
MKALTQLLVSRRQVLGGAVMGATGLALSGCSSLGGSSGSGLSSTLPDTSLPEGTDTIPQIDHIVVVMMENRSYDTILGMLSRGDGFTLGSSGQPTNTNPNGKGQYIEAFHLPTECRSYTTPTNTWNPTHEAYDGGKLDGFVTNGNGPAAMGYYTGSDIPFTESLASTFPINDRYFCSLLGPTFPNRRYLISGTSCGLVDDFTTFYDIPSDVDSHPANGTIFDHLNKHSISWKNYFPVFPTIALYPYLLAQNVGKYVPIEEFFSDASSGNLPSVSLVDPDYLTNSEGEGQDIQFGDNFLASVVNAVMKGPKWSKTLLVWTYDEAGGYYDHVVPPSAPIPDSVPPALTSSDIKATFDRYGIRVPMGLVSPYAKKNYVSSSVSDHTSILRLIETKWNLPALTKRDAAAHNLLDMVDFQAAQAFASAPKLASPANWSAHLCVPGTTGTIPPPSAVLSQPA